MVVIEVRNAELMETVAKEAKRLDISNGAIVSLIGAVDNFTISTMPKNDATKDIITDYSLPAEMTVPEKSPTAPCTSTRSWP